MWQLIKSIGANNAHYLHTRTNIPGKSVKTKLNLIMPNQVSSWMWGLYHESNIVPVHPIIVVLMDGGLSCAQSCLLQTQMAVVRYDHVQGRRIKGSLAMAMALIIKSAQNIAKICQIYCKIAKSMAKLEFKAWPWPLWR